MNHFLAGVSMCVCICICLSHFGRQFTDARVQTWTHDVLYHQLCATYVQPYARTSDRIRSGLSACSEDTGMCIVQDVYWRSEHAGCKFRQWVSLRIEVTNSEPTLVSVTDKSPPSNSEESRCMSAFSMQSLGILLLVTQVPGPLNGNRSTCTQWAMVD